MKSLVNSLLTFAVFTSYSAMALDADGCFQMYRPSVLYPVICVSGSNEEGIGGAGARVAFVGPNSLEVKYCGLTTSIASSGDVESKDVTFLFADDGTIRMVGVIDGESNREEGTVTIGKTELRYMRLLQTDSQRVLAAVYASGKCQN